MLDLSGNLPVKFLSTVFLANRFQVTTMVFARKIPRSTGRATSSSRQNSVPATMPPDSPISTTNSLDSIHSPFYLTNGDNPGLSLITEVIDGMNYDNWRIAMTISLDA